MSYSAFWQAEAQKIANATTVAVEDESKDGSAEDPKPRLSMRTQTMRFMMRGNDGKASKPGQSSTTQTKATAQTAAKQSTATNSGSEGPRKLIFVPDNSSIVETSKLKAAILPGETVQVSGRRSYKAYSAKIEKLVTADRSSTVFRDDVTPAEMAEMMGVNRRSKKPRREAHARQDTEE